MITAMALKVHWSERFALCFSLFRLEHPQNGHLRLDRRLSQVLLTMFFSGVCLGFEWLLPKGKYTSNGESIGNCVWWRDGRSPRATLTASEVNLSQILDSWISISPGDHWFFGYQAGLWHLISILAIGWKANLIYRLQISLSCACFPVYAGWSSCPHDQFNQFIEVLKPQDIAIECHWQL